MPVSCARVHFGSFLEPECYVIWISAGNHTWTSYYIEITVFSSLNSRQFYTSRISFLHINELENVGLYHEQLIVSLSPTFTTWCANRLLNLFYYFCLSVCYYLSSVESSHCAAYMKLTTYYYYYYYYSFCLLIAYFNMSFAATVKSYVCYLALFLLLPNKQSIDQLLDVARWR